LMRENVILWQRLCYRNYAKVAYDTILAFPFPYLNRNLLLNLIPLNRK